MKILTFTSLFPNSLNRNNGIFIQHRTTALSRCGNEIQVVAPIPYFPKLKFLRFLKRWYSFSQIPEQEIIAGLTTYHPRYFNPPKVGMSFYGLWMHSAVLPVVQQIYQKFPFEMIDAHYLYPDGLVAVWLGKKLKVPVVLSARGTDAHFYSRIPVINSWLRYALQNTTRIISVSENLKRDMLGISGVPEEKIRTIPNGIDSSLFYYGSQKEARLKLNLPPSTKIILMVASLKPRKNQDVLLSALSLLKNDERAYFIGAGENKAHLEERIKQEKLEQRAFLLGSLPQQDLPDWYRAADVMCLPSENEGSPNVVYESLGCGLPVVASNLAGVRAAITSPKKGIMIGIVNPHYLADALHQALWETEYNRFEISREAHLRTWDTVGQEVNRFLIETLENYKNNIFF